MKRCAMRNSISSASPSDAQRRPRRSASSVTARLVGLALARSLDARTAQCSGELAAAAAASTAAMIDGTSSRPKQSSICAAWASTNDGAPSFGASWSRASTMSTGRDVGARVNTGGLRETSGVEPRGTLTGIGEHLWRAPDRLGAKLEQQRLERGHAVGRHKVRGDARRVHVTPTQPCAREAEVSAQLAAQPRQEIGAAHVGEEADGRLRHCEGRRRGGRAVESAEWVEKRELGWGRARDRAAAPGTARQRQAPRAHSQTSSTRSRRGYGRAR
eukprot:6334812-Prymnesium_polylepis.1